jgi:hypothetical protein
MNTGNCITPKLFKNDSTLSFSSNFDNVFIQNVLLPELFRGFPILFNCYQEKPGDVIVINVRLINNHLNAIRILMLSWSISKFILCIVYSSLVTSNVIAPSTLISPWTEYKQLEKFTKVFGLNNQEMLRIEKHYKTFNYHPYHPLLFVEGPKASTLWINDHMNNLRAKYTPMGNCDSFRDNSSTCQVVNRKLYEFLESYRYAVRSNVQKLKEMLSVCTNTVYVDTETSIDHVIQILNREKNVPSMVKGTSFFQQSHYWTISRTWLLRKLISSRLKAFTTSGIIAFWERFCSKYCKKQPEHRAFHSPVINSNESTFNSQELESNLASLFVYHFYSLLCRGTLHCI